MQLQRCRTKRVMTHVSQFTQLIYCLMFFNTSDCYIISCHSFRVPGYDIRKIGEKSFGWGGMMCQRKKAYAFLRLMSHHLRWVKQSQTLTYQETIFFTMVVLALKSMRPLDNVMSQACCQILDLSPWLIPSCSGFHISPVLEIIALTAPLLQE